MYRSQLQPATGAAFREGQTPCGSYWLAGASGGKNNELLKRLEASLILEMPPSITQFEKVLDEFLGWFRQAYEQSKGYPCPDDDDAITRGVGLLWLAPSGQATFISRGDFQFCLFQNDQMMPLPLGYGQRSLVADTLVIADPTRSSVALSVIQAYRTGDRQWATLTGQTFTYPVGLLYVESITEPISPPPLTVVDEDEKKPTRPPMLVLGVLFALIVALLWGGYTYLKANENADPGTTTTDSTATSSNSTFSPLDSTTIDISPSVSNLTAAAVNKEDELPTDDSDTTQTNKPTTRPDSVHSVVKTKPRESVYVRPQPTQPANNPAEEYLNAAQRAFAKAEKYRADGKVNLARTQYETALASYKRFCVLEPGRKAAVQQPMATCRQSLQLLSNSPEFQD